MNLMPTGPYLLRRANCSRTTGVVGFISNWPRFSEASFSLIRLCNFNFLALLVNKSNKKLILKICKILQNLKKAAKFRSENCSKPFLTSGVMSSNRSATLEKLRLPVMIVKLRDGQKYSKILITITKFNEILLKFKIKKIFKKSLHCLKILSSIPISSLKIISLAQIHKLGA